MTLDLPHPTQRTSREADPWETAESWTWTWPSASALILGITPAGEVIGRKPCDTAPRLIGHVVALSEGRRAR